MSNIEPRPIVGGLKTIRLWLACISVLIGMLIYVAYGTDTLVINKLLRVLQLGALVDYLRNVAPDSFAPIRDQVPDGLWVFVGTILMGNIWWGKSTRLNLWLPCPLLIGIAGEVGQFVSLVPGTFDYLDILSMLIGYILGNGVGKKRIVT